MEIAIVIIVPAIIAFIMMFAKLSQMKTAVKQDRADNYMKRETFSVTKSKDVFLYSNTTKTPRPKSKS